MNHEVSSNGTGYDQNNRPDHLDQSIPQAVHEPMKKKFSNFLKKIEKKNILQQNFE